MAKVTPEVMQNTSYLITVCDNLLDFLDQKVLALASIPSLRSDSQDLQIDRSDVIPLLGIHKITQFDMQLSFFNPDRQEKMKTLFGLLGTIAKPITTFSEKNIPHYHLYRNDSFLAAKAMANIAFLIRHVCLRILQGKDDLSKGDLKFIGINGIFLANHILGKKSFNASTLISQLTPHINDGGIIARDLLQRFATFVNAMNDPEVQTTKGSYKGIYGLTGEGVFGRWLARRINERYVEPLGLDGNFLPYIQRFLASLLPIATTAPTVATPVQPITPVVKPVQQAEETQQPAVTAPVEQPSQPVITPEPAVVQPELPTEPLVQLPVTHSYVLARHKTILTALEHINRKIELLYFDIQRKLVQFSLRQSDAHAQAATALTILVGNSDPLIIEIRHQQYALDELSREAGNTSDSLALITATRKTCGDKIGQLQNLRSTVASQMTIIDTCLTAQQQLSDYLDARKVTYKHWLFSRLDDKKREAMVFDLQGCLKKYGLQSDGAENQLTDALNKAIYEFKPRHRFADYEKSLQFCAIQIATDLKLNAVLDKLPEDIQKRYAETLIKPVKHGMCC